MIQLLIFIIIIFLFAGTIMGSVSIKSIAEFNESDIWVKVKIRINDIVKACWCRIIPDKGVEYYDMHGEIINPCRERISVVEACLESNVSNAIPKDKLSQLSDGLVCEEIPTYTCPFTDIGKSK